MTTEILKTSTKYRIARHIAASSFHSEDPSYEELLQAIYENSYRAILKCPVNLYFHGIVESFIIKNIDQANRILKEIKEVTVEALEQSGIELTFTDEDWDKIKYVEETYETYTGRGWDKETKTRYVLNKLEREDKGYMCEFFEI